MPNADASADPNSSDEPDLARAVRALALAARSLERAAGDLTLAQYRVLAFVAAGHERSSIVAEGLALARPTVTATVDWLVERGMLTREAVAGDRRSVRLAVTRAGGGALRNLGLHGLDAFLLLAGAQPVRVQHAAFGRGARAHPVDARILRWRAQAHRRDSRHLHEDAL